MNNIKTEESLPEQIQIRMAKREELIENGAEPYPVEVNITSTISALRKKYKDLAQGEETDDFEGIAGRVMFLRNTGRLCFVAIQSGNGERFQAMISEAEVGKESIKDFKHLLDLGDHLYVYGRVISSKRGELSILANKWQITSKSIRPLPVLHKELSDETRMRKRYADMIVNENTRNMVYTRSIVMNSIRQLMLKRDFLEIETPMLQILHGGAAAKPFVTHMNAFDMDLYLRIAPELFLKRAVVGGIDRVFEINRNFRNEGADSSHSPEFAMMEAYEAYGTYDTIADLTKDIIQTVAKDAFGSTIVTLDNGEEYDFSGSWDVITLYGSLSDYLGEKIDPETDLDHLKGLCRAQGLEKKAIEDKTATKGKLVELLWEHCIGDSLHKPTFVKDFPAETSPLTRPHRTQKGIAEKWDLYIRGFEVATGYSELVDPVVQRKYFTEQSLLAVKGDEEAMQLDEDFLQALEFGMPPTGGMGMGIDRLLMALTGLGIRETVTFPLVKPIEK
jgi:lysyl-tRNA synthetase class 2